MKENMPHTHKFIHLKKLIKLLIISLSVSILIAGCLRTSIDTYRLSVQARGLSADESITVSNGSSVSLTGNDELSNTDIETFDRTYESNNTDYTVNITQQPTNDSGELSGKSCRVFNPTGNLFLFDNLIRIECGNPLTISDINDTATGNSNLLVSNGEQELRFGSSDTIVFDDLYLEGDPIKLSLTSGSQGCQFSEANLESNLELLYQSLDSVEPIEVFCGTALKISILGFAADEGDILEITATRIDAGTTTLEQNEHTLTLTRNVSVFQPTLLVSNSPPTTTVVIEETVEPITFNLAFEAADTYAININFTTETADKSCAFTSSGTDSIIATPISGNTSQTLTCEAPSL